MRFFATKQGASLILLVAAVFLSSCHKQVAKAPTVPPPSPAPAASPTVSLEASPASITQGEGATLTWSSSNATQLTLSPGIGDVLPQGSRRVSPTGSVTYTIRATGPGGTATATASVAVSAPYSASAGSSMTLDQLFQQNIKDDFFDYDKSDIRTDARDNLDRDAEFLRTHPDVRFTVEGHCDERGGEEYNLALGDRRATSTKQYLVSLGISASRIQTASLGKEHPFCTAENEACYQQNRRGHFVMAQ
jgi:peptidoglycan-associated lipoprotein